VSLAKFIDRENVMRAFMQQPALDINNITQEQAAEMFQRLDSNMSPEVLYADGERPRAKAMALAKLYRKAWADLLARGFKPVDEFYNMAM